MMLTIRTSSRAVGKFKIGSRVKVAPELYFVITNIITQSPTDTVAEGELELNLLLRYSK